MNTLALLLAAPSTTGLVQLLIYVAIAVVVIAAIIALVKWSGITIPQPVIIVFWALLAIILIIWLARAFGVMT